MPSAANHTPSYASLRFEKNDRHNILLHLTSGASGTEAIPIAQDVNLFAAEIDVGDVSLATRDALQIVGQESLRFQAKSDAHLFSVERKRA